MPVSQQQRPAPSRPEGAVSSAARRSRRLVALALLGAAAAAPCVPAGAQSIPIRRIEWSFVTPRAADASQSPQDEGSRASATLPWRWRLDPGSPPREIAVWMRFPLAQVPDGDYALLLAHGTDGGRFSVNGHFIGAVADESAARHVAWRRPQLLAIDPAMLRAGENEVLIESASGPGEHLLTGVEVGPMSELWNRYALQLFLSIQWSWVGATVALLVAAVFGALWLRRREAVSRLLTITAGCWLVYAGAGLVEIMPAGMRDWVHLAGMAAMAGFVALLSVSLLRLCGLAKPAWEWAIWVFAAAGPVLSALTAMRADFYLERSWLPGMICVVAGATGAGLFRRMQGAAAPHPLVLVAAILLAFAALLDFGGTLGVSDLDGLQALSFAGPVMLLALATPQIDDLMKRMHETEAARVELETRVREREQLLKRNFERLREGERIKAEAQERQRIMQDMHDGLGSQLLSSLMLVERGAVSNEQFAQILRESIDDMRLAIDTLAADDADLAAALGNLRFRMEPRLRAAGMELTWDARRLPEELGLHPDVVLPILRIVQEALTNALKHSRAKSVRVTLATEGTGEARALDIRIADNGSGIAEERVGGRGLLNMRTRAQKIGASLKIETAVNVGTTVHLRTRIGAPMPTTKTGQTVLNTQAVIEHARQNS